MNFAPKIKHISAVKNIGAISAFIACILASSAHADFCEALLDNLVIDTRYTISQSYSENSFHSDVCSQYEKTKDIKGSGNAIIKGIPVGANYSQNNNLINNYCKSRDMSQMSRSQKIEFISALNESFGVAIKNCSESETATNPLDSPISYRSVETASHGSAFIVEIFYLTDNVIQDIRLDGLENCKLTNIAVNKKIVLGQDPQSARIACDRKKGSGSDLFEPLFFSVGVNIGKLPAIELDAVKRVNRNDVYVWHVEESDTTRSFPLGGPNCKDNNSISRINCSASRVGETWTETHDPVSYVLVGGGVANNLYVGDIDSEGRQMLTAQGSTLCPNSDKHNNVKKARVLMCKKGSYYKTN